jgi:hypothetical protein
MRRPSNVLVQDMKRDDGEEHDPPASQDEDNNGSVMVPILANILKHIQIIRSHRPHSEP